MKKLGKMVCHIPARAGSKRVKSKNLRQLDGKPMIAYAIETAKACGRFDEIYVNTDSEEIMALAREWGVQVYKREGWLASDAAKGDDFTADFMEHIRTDTLVMISPVCPLVTVDDVNHALEAYADSECDTLITCEQTQMQVFCNGHGINLDETAPLAPSQENPFVQTLNWAVAIWDTAVFLEAYRTRRAGYLGQRRILWPIEPSHAVKVSHEADFRMAERMLMAARLDDSRTSAPQYWTPSVI
ncbi:MAG: acylneuraminate cytidylyltransferase family protein [Lentisphaerota bacterium]